MRKSLLKGKIMTEEQTQAVLKSLDDIKVLLVMLLFYGDTGVKSVTDLKLGVDECSHIIKGHLKDILSKDYPVPAWYPFTTLGIWEKHKGDVE